MSFQPAFNARLIAEVKKYPCLYNHAKRGSGDTMERMRIWEKIAAAVDSNCSGDFAKKRWLQLRDRYRKELKTAIKQNFVTPVRWCYFSHLSWLDPYLKDNLVLTACDGYSESNDGFSVDVFGLSSVKTELDDSDCGQSSSVMEASVIDRLLASTHQIGSQKHEVEDQNVSGSGAEDDGKSGSEKGLEPPAKEMCDKRSEKGDATIGAAGMVHLQHALPSSMVKNQIVARYQQLEQAMIKQAVNTGKSVMDWMNDEDFLYCRIIGVRLKRMEPRKRKRIRAQIMSLLEESENELEEDDDSMSSPNMDGGESSGYDPSLLDVTNEH
ncbi:hypothetical protein ANCCAN_12875 [Ancylostoma caninum]|uniref:MADF domain-containing protein n=1 Tax=Ancylostoma caninum TaxID=29170 RepID=A0A368G9U1_ANCCA|nr:hypothetical protein ANCCAN_12875 [Ancylostoma caninum]